MKCSDDPGATHHLGCECHETARNAELQRLRAICDAYKNGLDKIHAEVKYDSIRQEKIWHMVHEALALGRALKEGKKVG